jgi:hypothetical protein
MLSISRFIISMVLKPKYRTKIQGSEKTDRVDLAKWDAVVITELLLLNFVQIIVVNTIYIRVL